MCFSTVGSFGVGTVLVAAGCYTAKKAKEKDRNYLAFACLPLIFGIQQIIEGFVWIGLLHHHQLLVQVGTLLFTFIAIGFWPFFVPLSMFFAEGKKRLVVHQFLFALVLVGGFVGLYSYLPMLTGILPLTTKIVHHSISYDTNVPNILKNLNSFIYFFLVIIPFLVIPSASLRVFAVLLVISLVTASFFFFSTYLSVWCLFAAILSLDIVYILNKLPAKISS